MKQKLIFLFVLMTIFGSSVFSQVNAPSIQTSFQNFLNAESGRLYTGSALPVFLIKENTKGNRYLFEKWVKGSVKNVQGQIYQGSNALFNYDKLNKKLLIFLDSAKIIELNSSDIGSFTIGDSGQQVTFERLRNSTDLNFYQPVYKNEKGYSLYKLLKTTFKKADYQTNGLFESGNKFDEYVDTQEYYILSDKGELAKITFKKKSIEKCFGKESEKVDAFFTSHKNDNIDEAFVASLLEFINTQP